DADAVNKKLLAITDVGSDHGGGIIAAHHFYPKLTFESAWKEVGRYKKNHCFSIKPEEFAPGAAERIRAQRRQKKKQGQAEKQQRSALSPTRQQQKSGKQRAQDATHNVAGISRPGAFGIAGGVAIHQHGRQESSQRSEGGNAQGDTEKWGEGKPRVGHKRRP